MRNRVSSLIDLRPGRDHFLPPIVGGAGRSTDRHRQGKAETGKYRVIEVAIGRVTELLPTQRRETGDRAKALGYVDLGGVVVLAGAQALVFISGREFDLADQVQHQAAVTTIEQCISGAGNRVTQPAFHVSATTGQGVTIGADFGVGDTQPRHGNLVGHGAALILADHRHIPDFRSGAGTIVAT